MEEANGIRPLIREEIACNIHENIVICIYVFPRCYTLET